MMFIFYAMHKFLVPYEKLIEGSILFEIHVKYVLRPTETEIKFAPQLLVCTTNTLFCR
jgi:hypothetical protein